jgi:hypothetical protein
MKFLILTLLLIGFNSLFSQSDTIKVLSSTDSIQKVNELKQLKVDSVKLFNNQQLSLKFNKADSLFNAKKYKEAHEVYLGADKFNTDVVKDSLVSKKLKFRIDELITIFQCHQKIDSAQTLFQIKKYYEILPLLDGCEKYDTTNLLLNTKAQIKIIEDSILFEGYVKEIKVETDKKEYKKALEIISKAKLIKTNAYVDSTEAQNTRMVAFISEKNLKRFNDYKKIADDLVLFQQRSDTNSRQLLAKKEYFHNKYDTCIAYLKTTYKEVYAGVKSHQDFDKEKNEFKITDYWDDKDEEVFKLLEDLKSKTDYQNRFIAKIEEVIKNDDDKTLRNFRKYVHIKDIIYVFLLPNSK